MDLNVSCQTIGKDSVFKKMLFIIRVFMFLDMSEWDFAGHPRWIVEFFLMEFLIGKLRGFFELKTEFRQ